MEFLIPWARYASPRAAMRRLVVSCLGAGEKAGHIAPFSRRALPSHGVVYISEGRGSYRESSESPAIEVAAPAVIILSPGVEHDYGPDAAGWVEHWILFEGDPYIVYEDAGLADRSGAVVPLYQPIQDSPLLFEQLRSSLESKGPRSELAASLITQHFFLAILDAMDSGGGQSSVANDLARHAFEPMSVAARAQQLGITVEELRLALVAQTGLTPNEYILELRVSRAQTLLAETNLDIGAIAARVGYGDPAYFSRLFSRRVGVPPRVFRDQQARARSSKNVQDDTDFLK